MRTHQTFLTCALCALSALGNAQSVVQQWTRTAPYNAGVASSYMPGPAITKNGYYATAVMESTFYAYLKIHSRAGALVASRTITPPQQGTTKPVKVLVHTDGSIYVVCDSYNGSDYGDIQVVKYDAAYTQVWSNLYHYQAGKLYDASYDAALDSQGNVLIAGYRQLSQAGGDLDPLYLKVNANGTVGYMLTESPGATSDTATGVAVAANGTAYFCANASSLGIVRGFDSAGNPTASYTINLGGATYANDIGEDGAGHIFTVGFGAGSGYLHRYDAATASSTTYTLVGAQYQGLDVKGSRAVICGVMNPNLVAAEFDTTAPLAAPLWSQVYSYTAGSWNYGKSAFIDQFGEVYLLGMTGPSNVDFKYLTMRVSPAGTVRWAKAFLPLAGKANEPGGLALHAASGDIVVAGESYGDWSQDTVGLVGYIQAPNALPELFRPKKNTTYTSTATLTFNDRYYLGATCTLDTQAAHGTVTINANRTFTYVPNTNFVGTDTFKYVLTKPGVSPSKATVTLVVGP